MPVAETTTGASQWLALIQAAITNKKRLSSTDTSAISTARPLAQPRHLRPSVDHGNHAHRSSGRARIGLLHHPRFQLNTVPSVSGRKKLKMTVATRKVEMKDTVKENVVFRASRKPTTIGAREFATR